MFKQFTFALPGGSYSTDSSFLFQCYLPPVSSILNTHAFEKLCSLWSHSMWKSRIIFGFVNNTTWAGLIVVGMLKKWLLDSSCPSVRPSVCQFVPMQQLCCHWTDFRIVLYLGLLLISIEKINTYLKSDINIEYFEWRHNYILCCF